MRLRLARLLLLVASAAAATVTSADDVSSLSSAAVIPTLAPPDGRGVCDEGQLKRDAVAVLTAHFDVDLGAVAAGDPAHVGFQYLVCLRVLDPFPLTMGAHSALDDQDIFSNVSNAVEAGGRADCGAGARARRLHRGGGSVPVRFLPRLVFMRSDRLLSTLVDDRNILKYQRPDGLLPHLVYGPSVPLSHKWIASNLTYHPGPAFWKPPPQSLTALAASTDGGEDQAAGNGSNTTATATPAVTSTILAPPIAADVAWQIFRLAPYDAVLGVVSYQTPALQFLCSVYEPLKRLQQFILAHRTEPTGGLDESNSGRLVVHVSDWCGRFAGLPYCFLTARCALSPSSTPGRHFRAFRRTGSSCCPI